MIAWRVRRIRNRAPPSVMDPLLLLKLVCSGVNDGVIYPLIWCGWERREVDPPTSHVQGSSTAASGPFLRYQPNALSRDPEHRRTCLASNPHPRNPARQLIHRRLHLQTRNDPTPIHLRMLHHLSKRRRPLPTRRALVHRVVRHMVRRVEVCLELSEGRIGSVVAEVTVVSALVVPREDGYAVPRRRRRRCPCLAFGSLHGDKGPPDVYRIRIKVLLLLRSRGEEKIAFRAVFVPVFLVRDRFGVGGEPLGRSSSILYGVVR
jgi:hypothetical protein